MKKIYILPNLFTTANMFCGFFAIVSAINGNFVYAGWAMFAAMFFDGLDGRIARLAHATSEFGIQYDSLSDLLSFGITPAIVTYLWCLKPFGRLGWLAAFLYVVCTALRLARFNVAAAVGPKKYFQGLPSPIAAAVVASTMTFYLDLEMTKVPANYIMLPIMFLTASLMISNIHFPSFKEFRIRKENSFGVLAVGILFFILLAARPEVTLFFCCLFYVGLSLTANLYRIVFKKKHSSTPQAFYQNGKS